MGVLEILLTRAGRVVSKDQLMEHLYSYSEEASGNAIEVYIHRVRKKIEDGRGDHPHHTRVGLFDG